MGGLDDGAVWQLDSDSVDGGTFVGKVAVDF